MTYHPGTARVTFDGPYHLFPVWCIVYQPEHTAVPGGDGYSACGSIYIEEAPFPGRGKGRRVCLRCAQTKKRCQQLGLPLMRGTYGLRHDELLRVRKVTLEQAA